MSDNLKIVIMWILGILVGLIMSNQYYKNKIRNLRMTIDILRLQINAKEDKDDKNKIIKG